MVTTPQCGLGLAAQRTFRKGDCVLRESPIATLSAAALHQAFESDAVLRESLLPPDADPWSDGGFWPTRQRAAVDVIQRFAELEYAKLPTSRQEQWMNLVDSFSTPPKKKTPGNIVRSNAFTNSSTGDNNLFALLCRTNHSCAPNLARRFDDDSNVVNAIALCDIGVGEALSISYLSEADLAKPTAVRRQLLETRFKFVCECSKCGPVRAIRDATRDTAAPACNASELCAPRGDATHDATNPCYSHATAVTALEASLAAVSEQLAACTALLRTSTTSLPPKDVVEAMHRCADTLVALDRARALVLSDT